jgi:hypothetical protein
MNKELKILAAIAFVVVIAAVAGASYYRNSVQNARLPPTAIRWKIRSTPKRLCDRTARRSARRTRPLLWSNF